MSKPRAFTSRLALSSFASRFPHLGQGCITDRMFNGHDARVELSGRNLYMWSGYWAFDPEVNNWGDQQVTRFVDLASYPQTRSFFLGFDVAF